jgi:hypothetical protein
MNKNEYHLHVHKLSTVTLESSEGMNVSLRLKEIWDAPFKDKESLVNAMVDYTGRGFYCRVVEYK